MLLNFHFFKKTWLVFVTGKKKWLPSQPDNEKKNLSDPKLRISELHNDSKTFFVWYSGMMQSAAVLHVSEYQPSGKVQSVDVDQ